jgi:hypothetical protein
MRIFLLLLFLVAAPAQAVTGPWHQLERGGHFYEGRDAARLENLAEITRFSLPGLERALGSGLAGPVRVVVLPADAGADPDLARLDAVAPAWASGFALPAARLVVLRESLAGRYPFSSLEEVLTHELAHVVLADALPGIHWPRWFDEAVATRAGRAWEWRDRFALNGVLLGGSLPRLDELSAAFGRSGEEAGRAYAVSFEFLEWARAEYGEDLVARVLSARPGRTFEQAWARATGASLAESEAAWRSGATTLRRLFLAVSSSTVTWALLTALFLLAVLRRRTRTRQIEARWAEEERERALPSEPSVPPGGWLH